jgi:hypothetical protein
LSSFTAGATPRSAQDTLVERTHCPSKYQAVLWGPLSGGALGAWGGACLICGPPGTPHRDHHRIGGGVLVSVLSFDLMDEAQRRGGFLAAFMLTKWGG